MLLFLSTNWPHEELDQVESESLTYWIGCEVSGGAEGDRTPDLRIANAS